MTGERFCDAVANNVCPTCPLALVDNAAWEAVAQPNTTAFTVGIEVSGAVTEMYDHADDVRHQPSPYPELEITFLGEKEHPVPEELAAGVSPEKLFINHTVLDYLRQTALTFSADAESMADGNRPIPQELAGPVAVVRAFHGCMTTQLAGDCDLEAKYKAPFVGAEQLMSLRSGAVVVRTVLENGNDGVVSNLAARLHAAITETVDPVDLKKTATDFRKYPRVARVYLGSVLRLLDIMTIDHLDPDNDLD